MGLLLCEYASPAIISSVRLDYITTYEYRCTNTTQFVLLRDTMKIQTVSSWIDAPGNWTISAFLVVSVITVVVAVLKRKDYIQRVNKVPGMPGGFTILGNTTEVTLDLDFVTS